MDIGKKVYELIKETVNEIGLILDDCVYVKEGDFYYLRVIIDKNPLPTLEDCIKVNKKINPIIDNLDFLDNNYMLDVCTKERGRD